MDLLSIVKGFLASHGQIITGVLILNVGLSAAAGVLGVLHKSLPSWAQIATGTLQKALDWISANVPH